MVEQTRLAGSGDTHGHNDHPCHICSKHQACFQILGEVGPAVPEATGAAETNARLMIDRAPVEQPIPSEYEGG